MSISALPAYERHDPITFKLAADEQMERFKIQDTPRDQRGDQARAFLLVLFVTVGLAVTTFLSFRHLRRRSVQG